ncbi:hypothetical protein [Cellulomonas sp. PhB143]|uniref:hypothetical protein n=1 Tax=Cellulomonas sp. PhB143 TaxID=2485186 RepID=UPI000F49D734|nr:hypothetical protein [Cellulomonas sp. PhB143]ROS77039.1 hypothetical protein EDF32_1030 [Cellulomonas sp. PhB143]
MTAPDTLARPPGADAAPAVVSPSAAPRRPGVAARAVAALSSTPGHLRTALAVALVGAVVVGLLGFQAGRAQDAALDAARTGSERLVLLQDVRTDLVTADATATNAFLVGGLEPVDQREEYDARVASAARNLARLAQTGDAGDVAVLGSVGAQITRYTGLVEQARANNRQGFPVGSAYLGTASTVMSEEILPPLTDLVAAESGRVDARFDATGTALRLVAACLLGLVLLLGVQVWLARRTHRVLNTGLVTATAVVLVAGIVGTALLASVRGTADDVRAGPYTTATSVAAAETQANVARSGAGLGLIQRGSGADVEPEVQSALDSARDHLADAGTEAAGRLTDDLDAWADAHAAVRELDDAGRWDDAVAAATDASDDPTSSTATFATFMADADTAVSSNAGQVGDELLSAGTRAEVAAWLLLAAGAVAALASWRGVHRRLEEYR